MHTIISYRLNLKQTYYTLDYAVCNLNGFIFDKKKQYTTKKNCMKCEMV